MTEAPVEVPTGYEEISAHGVRAWVRAEAIEDVRSILEGGDRVWEWAGRREGVVALEGRAPTYVIPRETAGPDWVVRRGLRGGMVAPLLHDRYLALGTPRPFKEIQTSQHAVARGVATPRVIAGVVYGLGPLYQSDVVTEFVPRATTLADRIQHTEDVTSALDRARRVIEELSAAGVLHVDVNARNILLVADDETAWVIDLDRARVVTSSPALLRERMARRLARSISKVAGPDRPELTEAEVFARLARSEFPE